MSNKIPSIDYKTITTSFIQECTTLYSVVLRRVYQATRPKLSLDEILRDDTWRYDELPKSLTISREKNAASGGAGLELSKDQLARLVKWKITHGTHRPFLPGMIQKNSDSEVLTASRKAFTILQQDLSSSDSSSPATAAITKTIESALSEICVLKGVGPATGTLVLSVCQPDLIPFFEDELYHWLVPENSAKLKYDKREYKTMLERALEVVLKRRVAARCLEKVGYVLGHLDVLGESERKRLVKAMGTLSRSNDSDVSMMTISRSASPLEEQQDESKVKKPKRAAKSQDVDDASTRDASADAPPGLRRSKRTRQ